MDRRQARKVAYLVLADYTLDALNGGAQGIDEYYSNYGVTDSQDIKRLERAISGIEFSLRNRGNSMSATGGGGTRFQLPNTAPSTQTQTVVSSQNTISVPSPFWATPQGGSQLIPVSDTQLESMVTAEVDNRTKSNESFTAYDITTALRAANPTLNIRHNQGVREIVHDVMLGVGNYTSQGKLFGNGAGALEYTPILSPSTPVPALNGGGLTTGLLSN